MTDSGSRIRISGASRRGEFKLAVGTGVRADFLHSNGRFCQKNAPASSNPSTQTHLRVEVPTGLLVLSMVLRVH